MMTRDSTDTIQGDGETSRNDVCLSSLTSVRRSSAGELAREEMAATFDVFVDLIRTFRKRTVGLPFAVKAVHHAASITAKRIAETLSIKSRGVKAHFALAVALTSVLPVLTWLYLNAWTPSAGARIAIWASVASCCVLGYLMLFQYARALILIRDYLAQIAKDPQVSLQGRLSIEDSDLARMNELIQTILGELREKIATIERQKNQIADAERKKAIAESLATTCHYLGQPATVITAYIDLLETQDIEPTSARSMVQECQKAVTIMNDILRKLNTLSDFSSEEYLKNQSQEDQTRLLNLLSSEDTMNDEDPSQGCCIPARQVVASPARRRVDGPGGVGEVRSDMLAMSLSGFLAAIFFVACVVPVNRLVAQEQDPPRYWLAIESGEHGTVLDESGWFNEGDCVAITAEPDPYWHLDHWEGDVDPENSTCNPLIVFMDSDKTVRAVFSSNLTENSGTPEEGSESLDDEGAEPPRYWLAIESGEHGTVLGESGWFNEGDCVVITAEPDPYWHLDHWEGDVDPESSTCNPLIVFMDSDKTVRAVFSSNLTENSGSSEEGPESLDYEGNVESAALDDSGGDSMPNTGEYIAGSDSSNTESALIVFIEKNAEYGQGTIGSGVGCADMPVIKWASVQGKIYRVDATDDLLAGKFTVVPGAERIEATPPLNMFVDVSATNALARFYRVVAYCP